jgi:predicted negative regulator of RcsB-dependent stress response
MGQTNRRKEERDAYGKILSLVGDKRDTFYLPMTLAMLAQMDIMEGRFDEARLHLERAARETDEERPNPVVLVLLGELRDRLPPRSAE